MRRFWQAAAVLVAGGLGFVGGCVGQNLIDAEDLHDNFNEIIFGVFADALRHKGPLRPVSCHYNGQVYTFSPKVYDATGPDAEMRRAFIYAGLKNGKCVPQ